LRSRRSGGAAGCALALLAALASCGDEDPAPDPRPPAAGDGPAELRDPRSPQALQLLLSGRIEAAREVVEPIVAAHPELGEPQLVLGLCWHKQKSYARARPYLERAVAVGPRFERHASAHYYLGWCLYYLGEPEPARASFERHLALDPAEGDSHFGLGLIALDSGALDEAEIRFREAIRLHEHAIEAGKKNLVVDLAKCHARLADVHAQHGAWEDARRELEISLQLHPAHVDAWYKLAMAQRRLGDEQAAGEALRQHEAWRARANAGAAAR
jgi:tetratricopeptide (TPR) repeat protein